MSFQIMYPEMKIFIQNPDFNFVISNRIRNQLIFNLVFFVSSHQIVGASGQETSTFILPKSSYENGWQTSRDFDRCVCELR